MSSEKEAKLKALQLTLDKLDKTYGKGTVMKMGDNENSHTQRMAVLSQHGEGGGRPLLEKPFLFLSLSLHLSLHLSFSLFLSLPLLPLRRERERGERGRERDRASIRGRASDGERDVESERDEE